VISTEKPGTPSELVHFGTKGMKWGVRKSQGSREFHSKFTTPEARAQEIHRARAQVSVNKAGGKESSAYDKATALRFTRGEKFVTAALYTLAPTVVIPAGAAGYTAVKVGKRRALQK
jgi:hypothetical protein